MPAGVADDGLPLAVQLVGRRDDETTLLTLSAQLESARTAREEQLAALADIDRAHERVLANLSRVAATFQGLPAKVMRLRALDAQATDAFYGDLNDEVGRMNEELEIFEESLRSFHEPRVS